MLRQRQIHRTIFCPLDRRQGEIYIPSWSLVFILKDFFETRRIKSHEILCCYWDTGTGYRGLWVKRTFWSFLSFLPISLFLSAQILVTFVSFIGKGGRSAASESSRWGTLPVPGDYSSRTRLANHIRNLFSTKGSIYLWPVIKFPPHGWFASHLKFHQFCPAHTKPWQNSAALLL